VLKTLSLKDTTVCNSLLLTFLAEVDTSSSLALVQEYWWVKCCF